jgi:ribosomal-protein-alanine N-acetyltransferase
VECGRCVVRDWEPSDKSALVRFANNRNIWRNLTDMFPHPYTDADAEWWFSYLAKMPESTHWAIEVDGMAAGAIGVTLREGIFAKSAEFGYWLAEPCWGRGIMSAAAKVISVFALAHFRLIRLEAAVFEWNPASMRVLEKRGFVREGVLRASAIKDGQIIDRVMYALVQDGG